MQKLLTIVIPVYKVESYINKCLDSCLIYKTNEQGEKVLNDDLMNQLEIIIVNDGTPDRSAEMSREYVKRYPQTFRQIDKENGGHGSAWNVGLEEATGKYLRFLDSDDWLTNLDRLMQNLQECDADLVFNSFEACKKDIGNELVSSPKTGLDQKEASITKDIWKQSYSNKYSNVNFWGVTYKANILQPLHPLFAEKVMYDDYILTWASLIHGRTYVTFDYVVYNYLVGRPGNTMSVSKMQKRAASYDVCFCQYEKLRSQVDEKKIPSDLLEIIDDEIVRYAKSIFLYEVFLPYREAKEKLPDLYSKYIKSEGNTSLLRRYVKLPFCLFYWVEHMRYKKNQLTSNE